MMRLLFFSCLFFFLLTFTQSAAGQNPVQTIRGRITDDLIKTPVPHATIKLDGNKPVFTSSDSDGVFVFHYIPVGRHQLSISSSGYKPVILTNLLLESGKELVLSIGMEEDIITEKGVTIQSTPDKAMPLNHLATTSSRMFSVEETRRFAAGINDPSRIAVAYPGVTGIGDGNALIIRGNAPNGLLWRLEGTDIPSPNHFSRVGSSGGGIAALSAQLLTNSDFMTGAFPAEYGNALSGVFDIHLRNGNNHKQEYTLSASTIGIDAATEGPFKKGKKSSYLLNYRYGFLALMQQLGFSFGKEKTIFQDFSFHIYLPAGKAGTFSLFGFGGLSQQSSDAVSDSVKFTQYPAKRSGSLDRSNTGATGISHQWPLGKKTMIRSVLSVNGYHYREDDNHFSQINGPLITTRNNRFSEWNKNISVTLTHKFNSHWLLKAGLYSSLKAFNLHQRELVSGQLRDKIKTNGDTWFTHAFIQGRWDPSDGIRLTAGLHAQELSLNHTHSLEPRFGLRIRTGKGQFLSAGMGWHSQIQPLGNYFARLRSGNDTIVPNQKLGFSQARHYVTGYSVRLSRNWNFKTEVYYQWLYHIPVTAGSSTSFSLLNMEDDFTISKLSNTGYGENKGIEFTLERWWNDAFYFLGTLSLFEARYKASDSLWRNTRFNSNSAWTLVSGREWQLKGKQKSSFSADIKILHAGGMRVTPVLLASSIAQNRQVVDLTKINEEHLPPFFRIDLQCEWKVQYQHRTMSLIAGVQNLTGHHNTASMYYDVPSKTIQYNYLQAFIPVLGIKADF